MKSYQLLEIQNNESEENSDIILTAEFTEEEQRQLELVSPTIWVTVAESVILNVALCDEGLPVPCTFSDEEIEKIDEFLNDKNLFMRVKF